MASVARPKIYRTSIFTRYHRTKNAESATTNGIGLGLAIVCKIVEMHDARIDVQSQSEQGTTFTLRFSVEDTNEVMMT